MKKLKERWTNIINLMDINKWNTNKKILNKIKKLNKEIDNILCTFKWTEKLGFKETYNILDKKFKEVHELKRQLL